jgi:methyl-accepting chemotaxis protein
MAALADQARANAGSQRLRTNLALLLVLLGFAVVLLVTLLYSRRFVDPIRILTEQVESSAANHGAVPVAIADEGELGRLSNAIQKLVDLCRKVNGQPDAEVSINGEPAQQAEALVELTEAADETLTEARS